MIADPVAPEVDQQGQRRRDVEPDEEGEVERLVGRLRAPRGCASRDSSGEEHRVPEARDREQLGDALEHADDDGLEVAEHGCIPVPCEVLAEGGDRDDRAGPAGGRRASRRTGGRRS